jgi:hypothetical protein
LRLIVVQDEEAAALLARAHEARKLQAQEGQFGGQHGARAVDFDHMALERGQSIAHLLKRHQEESHGL